MKLKQLLFLPVFVLMGIWVQAQVGGTVTSQEDGMPLPGVSVIVSGTIQGATTDFDGNYVLENVDTNAILVFSYIGYKTVNIPVNGQKQLTLS